MSSHVARKGLLMRGSARSQSGLTPSAHTPISSWHRRKSSLPERESYNEGSTVSVTWEDGYSARFHSLWLRDHCPRSVHPYTLQRQIDTMAIDENIAPYATSIDAGKLMIQWKTPHGEDVEAQTSEFDLQWLRKHAYDLEMTTSSPPSRRRRLWDQTLENHFPTVNYHDLMSEDTQGFKTCLSHLYDFGAVMVKETPSTMEATRAASELIGPPIPTFYGDMWDTAPKSDEDMNDTAYSNLALFPHTDCTYLATPPAIQVFNCTHQSVLSTTDSTEGCTLLVDGFKVAEDLRTQHRDSFDFLSQTLIPYHCKEDGIDVRTMEPAISLHHDGSIKDVRINNDDRDVLSHLSFEKVQAFYTHWCRLHNMLRHPDNGVLIRLDPGDMLFLHNSRVLHGRKAFKGYRNLLGCYLSKDNLESQWRTHGINE